MYAPPILRVGRTTFSIHSLSTLPAVSPLLRLPPTHRAFHASPHSHLLNTILGSTHDLLLNLHSITHLPWGLTLPLSALLIRLSITLPLTLYNRRAHQRQLDLQPLLSSWTHHFRRQTMAQDAHSGPAAVDQAVKRETRFKQRELYRRWGCQGWKSYIPLVQLPIWFVMVETLRAMAGTHKGLLGIIFSSEATTPVTTDTTSWATPPDHPAETLAETTQIPIEPTLTTEGLLWFPNLTLPDPMLILPFALSASMLLNLYHTPRRAGPVRALTPFRRRTVAVFGLLALAVGPLTLQMPSAMLVYWLSSSLMGYVQAVLLDRFVPLRFPPQPCRPKVRALADVENTGSKVIS